MSFLKNLSIKSKISLLIAIFCVGFLFFGVFSYSTLNSFKINGENFKVIERQMDFQSDTHPADLWLQQSYFWALRVEAEEDPVHIKTLVGELQKRNRAYKEAFQRWKEKLPEGEIKTLLTTKADQAAEEFINICDNEFIPAALSGDKKKVSEINDTVLMQAYNEQTKILEQISKINDDENAKVEAETASSITFRTVLLIAFGVVNLVICLLLGLFMTNIIVSPLSEVVNKLKAISLGDTNQSCEYRSEDEIGALAEAFRDLSSYIREVSNSVDLLGNGDLSAKIAMRSDKDMLAKNVTQTVDSLHELIDETNKLIEAAKNGNLRERGNEAKFKGAYSELVGGFNQMLNAVTTPINEASEVLEKVANRDLTAKVEGNYKGDFAKIRESLNLAAANLDEGFQQVSYSASQVASAAMEISSGSQSLAQGASEQASTIEEVSSSLQEISSMTQQNATNSKEARSLSDNARISTERGMHSMDQLSNAIGKIKESSDSTAKIVKTIEEIAFQTNLLALNAAVEAARAGDAGKGFAVVAEEVRNLAMRSAEAAKTTAQLIDEAVTNTNHGVTLNDEVKKNLAEINEQIEKVSVVVSEIAAASDQQNQGVVQINTAIEQMNGVTQQTAANSEESASAAEELSSQSQEMMSLISRYKLSNSQGNYANSTYNFGKAKTVTGNGMKQAKTVSSATKKTSVKMNRTPKIDSGSNLEDFIPFDDMNDSVFSEF
ncbi:MAG: methyl-accepting chemotaxis protein [Pyrinomonadaceae bacterium]|nr:methyl-accepting chemotaxis protein [Pyrinomonadaceae bacterium]